jgi:hypothetical protein
MLKHVPRLTDFGWMAMDHSDFATEYLEPFGSFAAFLILETLDLDYDLFTLKQFAIFGVTWFTVQAFYTRYL